MPGVAKASERNKTPWVVEGKFRREIYACWVSISRISKIDPIINVGESGIE